MFFLRQTYLSTALSSFVSFICCSVYSFTEQFVGCFCFVLIFLSFFFKL